MRRARHIHPARAAVAVGLLGVIAATADAAPHVALILAPFFLLALFLSVGYFPGEELIERLRARRWSAPARPGALPVRRPAVAPRVRRVGRAFAFALAMRPPPAAPVLR